MADDILSQQDLDDLLIVLNEQSKDTSQEGGTYKFAGKVSIVAGVKIYFYDERNAKHNKPHFHARVNSEEESVFSIDPVERLKGNLRRIYEKKVIEWASSRKTSLTNAWNTSKKGKLPHKFSAVLSIERPDGKEVTIDDIIKIGKSTIGLESDTFLNNIRSDIKNNLITQGVPDELSSDLAKLLYEKGFRLFDSFTDDPFGFEDTSNGENVREVISIIKKGSQNAE